MWERVFPCHHICQSIACGAWSEVSLCSVIKFVGSFITLILKSCSSNLALVFPDTRHVVEWTYWNRFLMVVPPLLYVVCSEFTYQYDNMHIPDLCYVHRGNMEHRRGESIWLFRWLRTVVEPWHKCCQSTQAMELLTQICYFFINWLEAYCLTATSSWLYWWRLRLISSSTHSASDGGSIHEHWLPVQWLW